MTNSKLLPILASRNFVIVFSSFFFLWISFDFFILFPLFILNRGGNSVDVGIQTAIFYFPTVFIRPVTGWLTDKIGRLKVLWFGSALMVISAFSFLLLHGNYQHIKYWISLILLSRGLGFACFYVAFFTYTVDLTQPENRARVIGLFGLSGLIAHGAAPKIGELVLHWGAFHGFFIISGILSLLSLCISAFLKEQKRVRAAETMNAWQVVRSLSLTRRNWLVLPGAFTFGYVIASFNTFGAPYFQHVGQGSAGTFFLVYGGFAAVVRLFLGGLADRRVRWKLVTICFALQGAGLMLIILQPVRLWFLAAAAGAGAAHGILFPLLTAMAIDAHPQEFRGVVTSIFTAMIELGFSLGSYLLGVIVAYEGYPVMFVSAAVVAVIFSLYVLTASLRTPATKEDPV